MLGLLATSLVLWVLFAWRLARAEEPFLPLAVLGNPVVRSAALAGACNMGALVGMTIYVPLYFEVVLNLSASESGIALIPMMGATVLWSTLTGQLMSRLVHYKRVPLIGTSIGIASLAALAISGDAAALGRADAAVRDRLRVRHRVPDLDRVHAERGAALAVGHHDRRGQFLPRAVLLAHRRGARRHRARPSRRRQQRRGRGAGARRLGDVLVQAFRYVFATCALVLCAGLVLLILLEERPLRGPTPPSQGAIAPSGPATPIPEEGLSSLH